ncbi:DNA mismatch repair protein Mlh3 [Tachyglossus aculeatus]|uniref:DNA mismatch repair protein Mlh3 n=1 Tax=Tachyglossus aculeatus TaxID=9261 RepID=UPI0018F3973D|nr:DNA mismatch repair protein Mlh3 [Tachyglossus aculeatus]
MIRYLPEDVQAKLRSGVAISSLDQCVEELALNSIDAEANCVAVRVNMETFRVQVVDNGSGMGRDDVQRAGDRYFTSKCGSIQDLENPKFYGFRGEALASIASLAGAVEVSSKTNGTAKTFLRFFRAGKALDVCEADSVRPSVGTTVTVYNLFYRLPVRRKGMDARLEFEKIRQRIEALSLTQPSVSFSLKNEASGAMVLQLPKARDVRSRFCQIYGLGKSQKLKELKYKGRGFELGGYISSEAHYNRNMQFLFVNKRLVLRTRLHKLLDFLLRKESIICRPKGGPAGRPVTSSHPRHRSNSERHGIYVINVKCQVGEYDVCLEPAKTLIEFRNWDALLACVREGVEAFLKREQLFVELSSEDMREFSEDNGFSFAAAFRSAAPDDSRVRESFRKACDDLVDAYEMSNAKSRAVKRKAVEETGTLKSPGEAGDRAEPVGDSALRVIGEPDGTGGGDAGETPLPLKRALARDLPKPVTTEPEAAKSAESEETAPREPEPLPNGGDGSSDVSESESSGQASLHLEDSGKDPGIPEDEAIASDTVANIPSSSLPQGHAESSKAETETKCKPQPFGRPLVRTYDVLEEQGGAGKELSSNRGRMDFTGGQVKLCTTGFLTHLVQNPPSGSSEINPPFPKRFRPGPLSAREVFERKTDSARPAPAINRKVSNLNERPALLPSGKYHGTNTSDWLGNKTAVPSQNEQFFSHSGRQKEACTAPDVSDPLPDFSSNLLLRSCSSCGKKQIEKPPVCPRPVTQKKLRLFPQLGTLEQFKRQYGKVESSPSAGLPETKSGPAIPTSCNSPDELEIPQQKSKSSKNSGICETSTTESTEPSNVGPSLSSEKSPPSGKEGCSEAGEPPPRPTEPLRASRKHPNVNGPPGSLASKLSRMKGHHEEDPSSEMVDLSEQPPTDSKKTDSGDALVRDSFRPSLSGTREAECKSVILDSSAEGQNDCGGKDLGGGGVTVADTAVATARPPTSRTPRTHVVNQSTPLPLDGRANSIDDVREDSGMPGAPLEGQLEASDVPGGILTSDLKAPLDDLNATCVENEETRTQDGSKDGDPGSPSSDWLRHFDVSLGRTVYINKITGLSTFSAPPEEAPVDCTKDLTTVAVTVVSGSGFQFKCHPFRSDLVLPFLPSAQKARTMMKQDNQDKIAETPAADSLHSLFSEWDNPVFARYPEVAVDVSSGQADTLAVKIHNVLYPYRFTKEMIHSMQVLRQVDNKFIACLMSTKLEENEEADGNLIVLVDQHAAHERVRLEQLIADSYEKRHLKDASRRKLLSSTLIPPLEIVVTEEEKRLLRYCPRSLEDLGLELIFPEDSGSRILVEKVPLCFIEREANELRRGREPVTKIIVKELIREQVELLRTTGGAQATLPSTIQQVLASQACHGAIKFNDTLSLEESCRLIETLSWCHLPFQCAHGRPSMLPLADLDHMEEEKQPRPNMARLRKMARAWHLFGKPAIRGQSQSQQPPQEPP